MSATWLKTALLGVGTRPAFDYGGELGTLLEHIVGAEADDALAFSRALAAIAACRRAAIPLHTTPVSVPAPAADDARALPPTHPWCAPLRELFTQGPLRLQAEACMALARASAHLPATALPHALDAGRRAVALRPMLWPVLGTRGHWLARLNDDWKYAATTQAGADEANAATEDEHDERVWEEGALEARRQYFRALRSRDPEQARTRLREQWGDLPAKERLAFVELLAEGLSAADEPLLAPLLKDRSRDVRQTAAALLAALPDSAHAARLRAWLAACLSPQPGRDGTNWQCEAPTAADPDWAAAGIEIKRPPNESLGERAWWLYQLVRQMPLAWWNEHTGLTPEALLAWATRTDWKKALLQGWYERLSRADLIWAEAMLAMRERLFIQARGDILALLPTALRERHWPRDLETLAKNGQLAELADSCAPGQTLSLDFSRALLPSLNALLAGERLRQDYLLRGQLSELLCVLHPDSLRADAPDGWRTPPRQDGETAALAECLTGLERLIQWRRLFCIRPDDA